MEQSKALSKPDFRHILADINWEHGSHLVLAAKRSDSQGLLLKSVPFEYIADPNAISVDEKLAYEETRDLLASAIDALPEQEKLVVTLYYYEELTMKEVGQVLGVSESRVCQIHSSAVLRLRGSIKRLQES